MAKRRTWFKLVEAHGVKVALIERNRVIHRRVNLGRAVSASGKPYTRRNEKSLGHSSRERAVEEAKALCNELATAKLTGQSPEWLTLGQLFRVYREKRLPLIQSHQRRQFASSRMAMFTEVWGRTR